MDPSDAANPALIIRAALEIAADNVHTYSERGRAMMVKRARIEPSASELERTPEAASIVGAQ
jgi:hypothetical protein